MSEQDRIEAAADAIATVFQAATSRHKLVEAALATLAAADRIEPSPELQELKRLGS